MKLGEFTVCEVVGRGASGSVFLARGPDGADAAVKLLRDARPEALARFQRECELLARFTTADGFVPILGWGASARGPWLAMPFLPGGTLRDRLRSNLEVGATVALLGRLAAAIAVAHERGVVHRDLKPENVLFAGDGRPLIADLGIAKSFGGDGGSLSRTNELRGTPGYMAPEQMRDAKSVGPPADVFSLGAIAYECLTGGPPYRGTLLEVAESLERGEAARVRGQRPDVPRWLDALLARCVARDPALRPTAGELASALARGEARSRAPVALLAVVALAAAALGARAVSSARPVARETPSVASTASTSPPAPVAREGPAPTPSHAAPPAPFTPELVAQAKQIKVEAERLSALGDHLAAIARYDELQRLEPASDRPFVYRGIAHLELGDVVRARAELDAAVRMEGRLQHKSLVLRAGLRLALGDHGGARSDVAAAEALEPFHVLAVLIDSLTRLRAGEPAERLAAYASSGKRTPSVLVAIARACEGDLTSATSLCDRYLAAGKKGERGRLLSLRADLHARRGDASSAIQDLQDATSAPLESWERVDVRRRLAELVGHR